MKRPKTNQQRRDPKILVFDDNGQVRTSLAHASEFVEFQITTAADVAEALNLIDTECFDVLLSDLQMIEAGNGLAVVSAMHNTNPEAMTLLYTGYSELREALDAILVQADEILMDPIALTMFVSLIYEEQHETDTERAAAILECDALVTIADWIDQVERDGELTRVSLSKEDRAGHLSTLLRELVRRLRVPQQVGPQAASRAAVAHGKLRSSQGYSVPMIVEEFSILQASIFKTLQNNLSPSDPSLPLVDVERIADECDLLLKQTLISFIGRKAA